MSPNPQQRLQTKESVNPNRLGNRLLARASQAVTTKIQSQRKRRQGIKSSNVSLPLVGQRLRLSQSTKMLSQLRRKLRKKMPMAMVDKMIKKRSVRIPGHMQQLTELLGG
jgi:hypothetical protein